MSNSLRPHGLKHARPPCPSPTPRAYSNSCPSSKWCHPTISSSVVPFSSHLQSFPASGSFQISQFRTRWPKYLSFSFSISSSNEYSGLISFRIDRFDLLAVQETLKSFLQHHSSEASILWCSAFFIVQLSHPYIRYYGGGKRTFPLHLHVFVWESPAIKDSLTRVTPWIGTSHPLTYHLQLKTAMLVKGRRPVMAGNRQSTVNKAMVVE